MMILLVASRLNAVDRFSYAIGEVGTLSRFISEEVSTTVDELLRFGVSRIAALHYIAHANMWGSIEILEGRPAHGEAGASPESGQGDTG